MTRARTWFAGTIAVAILGVALLMAAVASASGPVEFCHNVSLSAYGSDGSFCNHTVYRANNTRIQAYTSTGSYICAGVKAGGLYYMYACAPTMADTNFGSFTGYPAIENGSPYAVIGKGNFYY